MKKSLSILCAAALALSLCACASHAPGAGVSSTLPPNTAAPAPEGRAAPVLSPGAADDSALSDLVAAGPDGALYTSLARADGLRCLYDLLPEDLGYIAGFLAADDGLYVSVRAYYYSLDPAALYFFPYGGDGEGALLADAMDAGGLFCRAGERIFYQRADDGALMCLALDGGERFAALPGPARLLCARDGFIYYARDGGVYANDSTMGAETFLFDEEGLTRLLADGDGFYALSNADDGAVLTIRGPDGTVRAERTFSEPADTLALCRGRLYLPQGPSIAVVDASSGETAGALSLPDTGAYCLVWYAAPDAVYYEDYADGAARLCRVGTDGENAQVLGERILV